MRRTREFRNAAKLHLVSKCYGSHRRSKTLGKAGDAQQLKGWLAKGDHGLAEFKVKQIIERQQQTRMFSSTFARRPTKVGQPNTCRSDRL
jgi:hypothetical protein